MSLTTIRTYGWLTGTTKQIRDISTYGWFAAGGPPPVFPVPIDAIIFKAPIELLSIIDNNIRFPVEIRSDVIVVDSRFSSPIEHITGLAVTSILSSDYISSLLFNNKTVIDNSLLIEKLGRIPFESLNSISSLNQHPIENRSESIIVLSNQSLPIGYLSYLSNITSTIPIEFDGTTLYVTSNNTIPIELLSNIIILPSTPIEELDYPLAWYLDGRGVLWVLDARTCQWIMDQRHETWLQEMQIKDWVLQSRDIKWSLEDSQ